MPKILKETSGLAISSFVLAVISWLFSVFNAFLPMPSIPCNAVNLSCGTAALLGITALIYIRKTKLKGKLLAIIGIILGAIGAIAFVCL